MKFNEANITHYEGLTKEMPVMWMLILSCLTTGYFLAFIFYRWANISTWKQGLTGGLIIGLFQAVMYDLSFMSMYNLYNATAILVDILAATIVYGITGTIVGWVLSSKTKTD